MPLTTHINFRLTGIPLTHETKDSIRQLVKQTLDLDPTAFISIHSLAVSPSDHTSRVATISFLEIPVCFLDQPNNEWTFHLKDGEDLDLSRTISFDTHFRGFTPFQRAGLDDCHVDIIAVTGLGGHALGSFKKKNGPFVWLRDGLPVDVPNARILSYGYDTTITNSSSFQNLTDLARSLHLALGGIQDWSRPRRIVFIAHSLGGLLVKETIVQVTQASNSIDRSMLESISGFMFFGVPHEGLAVECLVPMIRDLPNRALLESLGKNSALLSRLQQDFSDAIGARRRRIVSFYETERSSTAQMREGKWELTGPSEVLVEVSSANCGSFHRHPINRNHSEIVKFSSRQDDVYLRVILALRPLLVDSRTYKTLGAELEGPGAIEEKRCLQSLSFQEQDHRYAEVSYDKDTCEWLLGDSNYKAWLEAPRGLFWIKGSPGTGKSVLMKFAVEAMQRRCSGELVVSFFIHGRGVPLQKTPLGVFRALLSSLLASFPTYLQELVQRFKYQEERFGRYERKDGWTWTESELQEFTSKILSQGTSVRPLTIYVDALDECGEHDAKRLLNYFNEIISMVDERSGLLKICFSSRHYPILGFETMPTLVVDKRNGQDIELVVQGRLNGLELGGNRQQIQNNVLSKAQGSFQWAILVTDIIRNGVLRRLNSARLLQTVNTIPESLQDLYEALFSGVEGEERAQMVRLFQWVLFPERPLSSHELREALITSQSMTCGTISQLRDHLNYSDTVSGFEFRVTHISRGLLEFRSREVQELHQADSEDWDREVQFIHQSAADFVLQRFLVQVNIGTLSGSVDGMGHFEISRSCLKYITLREILESNQLSRRELSARFPLLPYTTKFLLRHIELVEHNDIPQADLLGLFLWYQPDRLNMFSAVWLEMDPSCMHAPMGWPFIRGTALHILVAIGSLSALQAYLDHNTVTFDAKDSDGNTALLIALREGREALALFLLDQSIALQAEQIPLVQDSSHTGEQAVEVDYLSHVNTTNDFGETPLKVAIWRKADKAILALVRAGADLGAAKGLLFYAISNLDQQLLLDLIERQVCLDGAVCFAIQIRLTLSETNHLAAILEIISTLLSARANTRRITGVLEGSDLGWPDSEHHVGDDEAAVVATRHGLASVVKLLITHGISVTVRDIKGRYPLATATYNDDPELVEVLFSATLKSGEITQSDIENCLTDAIYRKKNKAATILLKCLYGDGVPSEILRDWPESALHIALDLDAYKIV